MSGGGDPVSVREVVVLGGGQAGYQAAASLRQEGFEGRIHLVHDETDLPYQRPPLSKAYLKPGAARETLLFRPAEFYQRNRIELSHGHATRLHRAERRVELANGRQLAYDHLILAVGARNRALPLPGADLAGVLSLRSVEEAEHLREALPACGHLAIVGAGFIGLECAAMAASLGIASTILDIADRAMQRAVAPAISAAFQAFHARHGTSFRFHTGLARILGEGGQARAVQTSAGETVAAGLVIIAAGVVPNVELAVEAGLPVQNGIVVDATLLTADPAISAIGDCALFPTRFAPAPVRLESVQNATDQARAVALRLVGKPAPYDAVPWFWSDQGAFKLQMAGLACGGETDAVRGDPAGQAFSVFRFRDGRLACVESVNRMQDHQIARRLLARNTPFSPEQAADPAFDLKALLSAAPA